MLKNNCLAKKVEKEIEKMLLSLEENEVVNDEAANEEPEMTTLNHGEADDDESDSIPP
jgi:hypothetical protein